MTTNGVLLAAQAAALRAAGLHRVTVSLDTLRPDRFRALTRRDEHAACCAGIEAVRRGRVRRAQARHGGHPRRQRRRAGRPLEFGAPDRRRGAVHRVHGRGRRDALVARAGGVPRRRCWSAWARRYGAIEPIREVSSAPAERFRLPDGTTFGIIASTTDAVLPDVRPEPADGGRHCGISASTPARASTCGRRSATGRRAKSFGRSSRAAGAGAGTAAPRSGRIWRRSGTGASWSRSRGSSRILTSRCTRAAAEPRAPSASTRPALTLGDVVARLLPS